MILSDISGWLMLIGVEIYVALFILAVIYQNVKNHELNIFLYIVPILFTALSGINCAMLQLLTSTNLTEIIMGFGHGMDRGTIIMSFGILGEYSATGVPPIRKSGTAFPRKVYRLSAKVYRSFFRL